VTLAVVLIGLAGVTAMLLGTTKANAEVMNYQRALTYTEELMEEMMTVDYVDLPAQVLGAWDVRPNDETHASNPSLRQIDDIEPPNPTQITFSRAVAVTDIAGMNLRRVTVTTSWDDETSIARGTPHTLTLESLRSPDPL
jgi:hypothetical protein